MKQKNWLPSLITLLLSLFFVLIFLSCKRQPNVKPLNEKLFVQVYCDVVVYADIIEPTHRDAFVDSVLNHYGVSREQFLK
ncbi:MAG: hypothetical protein ONB13_13130, partial [candidate division KSB1 bacterium]|nr:hypothetical protein [candidate division KSB1 bacterium]